MPCQVDAAGARAILLTPPGQRSEFQLLRLSLYISEIAPITNLPRQLLYQLCQKFTLERGIESRYLFHQGDHADKGYILLSGAVQVRLYTNYQRYIYTRRRNVQHIQNQLTLCCLRNNKTPPASLA